jgi:hypothetical protein
MALLDWFRQSTPKIETGRISPALIDDTIDYVVKMTDARLTLVNNYRARLQGPVTRTLQHLGTLQQSLPASHEVGPQSWSQDVCMRAFFARPADLLKAFSQSQGLHDFAAQSSALEPIHTVLAMNLEEQTHFGVGLQGDTMVRDVVQTSLNFSHHRLRLFAHSEKELLHSMSRRLLDELAIIALGRMQAEQDERRELEEHRGLLSARLATFHERGAGVDSFLGEAGDKLSREESGELLHQLESNETHLAALGSPAETLDRQLDYLAEILAEPMRFVKFELHHPHINNMNVVVGENDGGNAIEFGRVSVDRNPPQAHVFVPIRVDHALIGDGRRLQLDNAERWL